MFKFLKSFWGSFPKFPASGQPQSGEETTIGKPKKKFSEDGTFFRIGNEWFEELALFLFASLAILFLGLV